MGVVSHRESASHRESHSQQSQSQQSVSIFLKKLKINLKLMQTEHNYLLILSRDSANLSPQDRNSQCRDV